MFKVTIKTKERCQWRHSGVFIAKFENISHFVLVFVFTYGQLNTGWDVSNIKFLAESKY